MEGIIAFCKNPDCGAIFQHKGIIGGAGSANITFLNSSIGPCPNCGGMGDIPNGVYEYFDNQIEFIKGPKASLDALRKVEALLRTFQKIGSSQQQVLDEVKKIAPEIAINLEKIPKKFNYNQWINTLIAFITVIILVQQTYFKDKSDSEIKDKFIEYLLSENNELKKIKNTPTVVEKKPGRNDNCYCGSGLKYKKCCLLKEH